MTFEYDHKPGLDPPHTAFVEVAVGNPSGCGSFEARELF